MLKKYFYWVKNNIWKLYVFALTGRRNFIPILFLYYLTIPNTTIIETWILTSVGMFCQFLLEIPSWYISDIVWHKKTLILNKIFILLSMFCFVFANWFWLFLLWFVLMHIGMSLSSGTREAFLHETLESNKQNDLYTKISGRMWWTVSLISAVCIFALPFLTDISYVFPIVVWLFMDVIWLIISLTLVKPKVVYETTKTKRIWDVIKELKWKRALLSVLIFLIFLWIWGTDTSFRYLYLEDLWYVVKRIGAVMWLSRVVRFVLSRYIHKIEKVWIKKVMLFMIIFSPLAWFLAAILQNPYLIWVILSLKIWMDWALMPIFTKYIINNIPDKKYKATILSIKAQWQVIIKSLIVFGIWFVMNYSFRLWYVILATLTLILLWVWFFFMQKYIKNK